MSSPDYHNRKYDINEHFFDCIDSEEKAYFLGFLYADGYNHPASSLGANIGNSWCCLRIPWIYPWGVSKSKIPIKCKGGVKSIQ